MTVPGPSVMMGDDGAASDDSSPGSLASASASKHFGHTPSRASGVSGAPHFRQFASLAIGVRALDRFHLSMVPPVMIGVDVIRGPGHRRPVYPADPQP